MSLEDIFLKLTTRDLSEEAAAHAETPAESADAHPAN
jgi:hypothetical protein